jgi:hypothetical protein
VQIGGRGNAAVSFGALVLEKFPFKNKELADL